MSLHILEQIRGDRFLQEAPACGADPLHLAVERQENDSGSASPQ